MISAETVVHNRSGLHARPAAMVSSMASSFKSTITIKNLSRGGDEVNAKSITRLMSLALSKDTKIQICAEGEDAQEAVRRLIELIDTGLADDA